MSSIFSTSSSAYDGLLDYTKKNVGEKGGANFSDFVSLASAKVQDMLSQSTQSKTSVNTIKTNLQGIFSASNLNSTSASYSNPVKDLLADFSNTQHTDFTEESTIFKALSVNFDELSKEQLEAISKDLKVKELSQAAKEAQKGLKTVFFRDPITAQFTQSALSMEAINALREQFGKESFLEREDGSFILSGEAEKFVSGWYGDIAYTRAYLKADANNDGFMEQSELDKTKSGFMTHGYSTFISNKVLDIESEYVESYIELGGQSFSSAGVEQEFKEAQKTFYEQGKFAEKTLALELDKIIKQDKDFNGVLQHKEATTLEERRQKDRDTVEYIAKDDKYLAPLGQVLINFSTENKAQRVLTIFSSLAQGMAFSELDSLSKLLLEQEFPELFKTQNEDTQEFDKEKFDEFYEAFKDDFKRKSASYIGLTEDEASKLSFERLSEVVLEIAKNTAKPEFSVNKIE